MLTADDVESLASYAALLHLKSGYTCFCDVMEAPYAEPGFMLREAKAVAETGARALVSNEATKRARNAGHTVLVETCPQYLLLDIERYDEPDFGGAKYVMSPPLRERYHQEVLWNGLAVGDVDAIGTDHCPFNLVGQKDIGGDDFTKIPNGMPGVETRVPLLYHEGVNKGRISVNRFVELLVTNPARIFGLLPQKGTIAVGSDADLVVWDPDKEMTLSVENLHMNVDHSPYEDITGRGYPELVLSRGRIIVKDNQFQGQPGNGRFLRREPFGP